MIVIELDKRLPSGFKAAPNIHLGAEFEIDIAAYEEKSTEASYFAGESNGGTATAVWAHHILSRGLPAGAEGSCQA